MVSTVECRTCHLAGGGCLSVADGTAGGAAGGVASGAAGLSMAGGAAGLSESQLKERQRGNI